MNFLYRATLISVILVQAFYAKANQDTNTSTLEFTREATTTSPAGVIPFLAIGGGYTGYDSEGFTEGSPSTLKLLGSYYFQNPAALDLGYGVNNQQFTQSKETGSDSAITNGTIELALRYIWTNRWQTGVVANHLINQGSNYTAAQADAQFVGLQMLKEFNFSQAWLGRVGARVETLTNTTSGNVTMYMIDLQLGWNPGAYRASARVTKSLEKSDSVVTNLDQEIKMIAANEYTNKLELLTEQKVQ